MIMKKYLIEKLEVLRQLYVSVMCFLRLKKRKPIVIEGRGFYKCCAEEIRRLWTENGGSMNIVHYVSSCPKCNHFIGLTQTDVKEANEFLEQYELEPIN